MTVNAPRLPPKPLPSVIDCISDIFTACKLNFEHGGGFSNYTFPQDFLQDLHDYAHIEWADVRNALVLAVLWTVLRYALTVLIFKPVTAYVKIQSVNAHKFPESAWKTLWYAFAWLYTFYVTIYSGRYDFFQRPLMIWRDYAPGASVPSDIYWLYQMQISFYIHSIYGTLFLDHWRKDSIVMMFHHFLTITLIGFSYASRYVNIGVLLLYLHDLSDVCLEFTKCNVYLKSRNNQYHRFNDGLATGGFIVFAGSWFVNRIWLFLLKVLHSASYGVFVSSPLRPVPFQFLFNVLLYVLAGLNCYWFGFIVLFVYRILTGQMREIEDVREEEVEAAVRAHQAQMVKAHQSADEKKLD